MEEKKTRTKKQMDLLTAIEQIVEKAKDSKLSSEFYRKVSKYTKYVSEKLDLTKEQSVMLAMFMNRCDDTRISFRDISSEVKCNNTCLLRYMNDIDELEKREFLRKNKDRYAGISYRIPSDVLDALRHDEKYVPKRLTGLTCEELIGALDNIFEQRRYDDLSYEAMTRKINSLLADNPQLTFTQTVEIMTCDDDDEEYEDRMLLLLFCHLFVNNNDNNISFNDLDFLYEDKCKWYRIKGELSRGIHFLFDEEIIEFNNHDGMVDRESFRVTQKAKEGLLSEIDLSTRKNNNMRHDILGYDQISEKKLFYGATIQSQIDELSQLLENAHYQEICTRMKNAGFRCGFTCLFYGAPGTGKTETVFQLARKTGRDILQVDVSKIKSCWIGQSEKNIKNLFDNYRERVKKSENAPILLFNEADAIINMRQEGAAKAVEKMENSIQNIILQEMENLDGILIATTNLVGNMDKAFERRFLYKIKFEKPTLEARMNIWHTMIPALDEDVTRALASKYDFSGGQIENIARHYAINNILHGESDNTLDTLTTYCDNERLVTKEIRKIGF